MTISFLDIVGYLQAWADQQQLQKRALEACRAALINCLQEDLEVGAVPLNGWKLEDIQLRFARHALIFAHQALPYLFIETRIVLYVHDAASFDQDHERQIGSYRLITLLDGTTDDDYLVLDDTPDTEAS